MLVATQRSLHPEASCPYRGISISIQVVMAPPVTPGLKDLPEVSLKFWFSAYWVFRFCFPSWNDLLRIDWLFSEGFLGSCSQVDHRLLGRHPRPKSIAGEESPFFPFFFLWRLVAPERALACSSVVKYGVTYLRLSDCRYCFLRVYGSIAGLLFSGEKINLKVGSSMRLNKTCEKVQNFSLFGEV